MRLQEVEARKLHSLAGTADGVFCFPASQIDICESGKVIRGGSLSRLEAVVWHPDHA